MTPQHERIVHAARETAFNLVRSASLVPCGVCPREVMRAIVLGAAEAGVALLGGRETFDTLQPILDGICDQAIAASATASPKGTRA